MDPIIERTIGQRGYEILQTIAAKEVGFNQLLDKFHMNNHTLRNELRKLEKEGYIAKKPRKEFEQRSGPGRPKEPYSLTKKGDKYHAVIKDLEDLRSNTFGPQALDLWKAGRGITGEQYVERRRKAYNELGVPYPTAKEMREKNLDLFADSVRNLGPRTILLIEEVNAQPQCSVFIKPFYAVKHEKGPPKRTVIEKMNY